MQCTHARFTAAWHCNAAALTAVHAGSTALDSTQHPPRPPRCCGTCTPAPGNGTAAVPTQHKGQALQVVSSTRSSSAAGRQQRRRESRQGKQAARRRTCADCSTSQPQHLPLQTLPHLLQSRKLAAQARATAAGPRLLQRQHRCRQGVKLGTDAVVQVAINVVDGRGRLPRPHCLVGRHAAALARHGPLRARGANTRARCAAAAAAAAASGRCAAQPQQEN